MTKDGKLWKDLQQEKVRGRFEDLLQTSWQVEAPATTTFLGDSSHRRSPRDSKGRRCSFCFVRGCRRCLFPIATAMFACLVVVYDD